MSSTSLRRLAVLLIVALPACSGAGPTAAVPATVSAAASQTVRRAPENLRAFAAKCIEPDPFGPVTQPTPSPSALCPQGSATPAP